MRAPCRPVPRAVENGVLARGMAKCPVGWHLLMSPAVSPIALPIAPPVEGLRARGAWRTGLVARGCVSSSCCSKRGEKGRWRRATARPRQPRSCAARADAIGVLLRIGASRPRRRTRPRRGRNGAHTAPRAVPGGGAARRSVPAAGSRWSCARGAMARPCALGLGAARRRPPRSPRPRARIDHPCDGLGRIGWPHVSPRVGKLLFGDRCAGRVRATATGGQPRRDSAGRTYCTVAASAEDEERGGGFRPALSLSPALAAPPRCGPHIAARPRSAGRARRHDGTSTARGGGTVGRWPATTDPRAWPRGRAPPAGGAPRDTLAGAGGRRRATRADPGSSAA